MKSKVLYYLALIGLVLSLVAAQEDYVYLYGGGVYQPGDDISLEYQLSPGSRGTLTLYRILNPEKVIELGGPQQFQNSDDLSLRQVNQYTIRKSNDDYYYGDVNLGRVGPGMYFAQLESNGSKSATLLVVSDL